MESRFFAFGCSYVNYKWLSLADLIGVNFKNYYNLGVPGCCNNFICDRVILANEYYQLTDQDFILIGLTGIRRFSFYTGSKYIFHGDIYPRLNINDFPEADYTKEWALKYENYTWALKRTLFNIKTIRALLDSKKIKYKIYNSFYDNILYDKFPEFDNTQKILFSEILKLLDMTESIDSLALTSDKDFFYKFIKDNDGHPTAYHHYQYLKKYFPEYNTVNTEGVYLDEESKIDLTSSRNQSHKFTAFKEKYRQSTEDFENLSWY